MLPAHAWASWTAAQWMELICASCVQIRLGWQAAVLDSLMFFISEVGTEGVKVPEER